MWDYRRSDWEAANQRVSGPSPFLWSGIRYGVVHEVGGGPNWRPGPSLNVAQHLRNSQHNWVTNRNYSLGYMGAVVSVPDHELDGTLWEIRGTTWRGAATAGVNAIVAAILCISQDGQPCTPKATARLWRFFTEAQGQASIAHPGRILEVFGHNEVPGGTTRTSCPGNGRRAQVLAGVFGPGGEPPPTPEPEPEEIDDMPPFLVRDAHIRDVQTGGGLFMPDGQPVSPEMLDVFRYINGGPLIVIDNTHPHWRAATLHKMGPAARKLYGYNS